MKKKELTFEESLTQLEAIVEKMESGDMSLNDLMLNYSEGIKLSNHCYTLLERAEKAMDLLVTEKDGKLSEVPLELEGDA